MSQLRSSQVGRWSLGLSLALFLWLGGLLHAASAVTYTVNSLADTDDGTCDATNCTLREAIENANDNGNGTTTDTINLSGVSGTIQLTNELPVLDSKITLTGPGANSLTVHRNSGGDYGIFNVASGTTVSISGLTLTNGDAGRSSSGGITNAGTLTLTGCALSANSAAKGAGLDNTGTATLTNCTFNSNVASASGGGLYNSGGIATVTNCTFSGNSAGNSAGTSGGGIYNNVGTLTLTNCTLSGNSASYGGGILSYTNNDFTSNSTTLTNCTLSGNTATYGGGILNDNGLTTIQSSTLTLNTAPAGQGSGVETLGSSDTRTTVSNSIIAGNTNSDADSYTANSTTAFVSNGYNLIGTSNVVGNFSQSSDRTGVTSAQVNLGPLADNGGLTQTQLPQMGSLAIDAGNATGTDQRGLTRPYDFNTLTNASGGNGSDIGAVEVQGPAQQSGPTFTVTNIADHDDGSCGITDCTLREAINASNAKGGTNTIIFNTMVFGTTRQTIRLGGTQIVGASSFTITGPSVGVTVNGNAASTIFTFNSGTVGLSNLTLTNGKTTGSGGGINNGIALTLTNCALTGNHATNYGGAINSNSTGSVTLTGCTLSGNSASYGGGIYNNAGTLTLTNCTLSGNSASYGGGIFSSTSGYFPSNSTTLTNCTLSSNSAPVRGGGICNDYGLTTIQSSTLTLNTAPAGNGSGVATFGGGFTRTTVSNSIIAGNTNSDADSYNANNTTVFVSNGYNLIGTSNVVGNFSQSSDRTGVTSAQVNLGPLADNGGPTFTQLPQTGSLAIDTGSATGTDQRGVARPFDVPAIPNALGSNGSDIGAVEVQLPILSLNSAVTGGNNSVTFTEKGGPINLVDSTATLSDPNSATLTGGTVSLVSTPSGGSESLAATTTGTGVSASYNAGTRTLTLSGTDTLAHYLQVLKTVTYNNTALDPTAAARTATFAVVDSNNIAAPVTSAISVTTVNDAPTFTPGGNVTVAEDSGAYAQAWASSISAVEAGQTVTFLVSNNNPSLFAVPPAIAANGTLSFTPAPNANGSATVTVQLQDNGGTANGGHDTSAAVTFTLTVTPVDDAPVAASQNVTTAEDTALALTLSATDIDSPTLTYAVVTPPAHGTLSGTAPNLTYTPSANYNGSDSFTFKANDGSLDSSPATVSITVTPVNDAPVATNGSVTTTEDTPVSVTLAATDVDSPNLTYTVVTAPAHGTLGGSGANLTYTPAANYNGTDSFTFKANDGALDSNTATVAITVTHVDDAPVASDDAYTLSGLQPLTVAAPGVLGNDTDVEHDTLRAVLVTNPTHGSLTLNGDGSFTYTPAVGYNGSDSFTYQANDGTLDSNVATVTLNVSGNPGQSVTLALANSTVQEGQTVSGMLTLSRPSATAVTVTLLSSQTATATVPTSVTVPAGQTSVLFTVTASKNPLATGAQTVTISANAGDYGTAAVTLTVTDKDVPTLTLTVAPTTINENYGPAAATATVTRNTLTTQSLRVTLLNSNPHAVTVPTTVIIPAGAASTSFFVAAVDNRIVNKPQSATLTAHLSGYKDGAAKLTLADNGKVTQNLKLTLTSGTTYTERVGGQTVTGTISLSGKPLTKNLAITLVSSDPKRVSLPTSVLLKAGQSSVTFTCRILDNTVADGLHSMYLTARAAGYGTSAVLVTIQDNDGPSLSLSVSKTTATATVTTLTGTLTRLHVPTTTALMVSLASSDRTRVTVPTTVTIPAGKAAVTFTVSIKHSTTATATHIVTLTASKTGLVSGTTALTVQDTAKPAAPAEAPAPRSTVGLSTATATVNGLQLRFLGALDVDSALDATHYTVTVNGTAVAVESVAYAAATHTMTVTVPEGAVASGDSVVIAWQGLQDTQGRALAGTTGTMTTR